jgi:hypothetical protein
MQGLRGAYPRSVAEHEGWEEEPSARPGILELAGAEARDEYSFVEHPLCCATLECTTRMLLQLRVDVAGWREDHESFTEATASVTLRLPGKG